MAASHLNPQHPQANVLNLHNVIWLKGLGETGPSGARIKLVNRGEKGLSRHYVNVDSRFMVVPIPVLKRGSVKSFWVTAYSKGVRRDRNSFFEGFLNLVGDQLTSNGAEGGIRTRTACYSHWILSPARLPFPPLRHLSQSKGSNRKRTPLCQHRLKAHFPLVITTVRLNKILAEASKVVVRL